MKKLKQFINNCEKAVILYHIDTDGICSAKIIGEALHRMNKEIVGFFPATPKLITNDDFQIGIKKSNPDLIVVVDIELKKDNNLLNNNKDKKFLIIDHHKIDEIPKGENIIYINPKLEKNNEYYPASKLTFETMEKIVDIVDLDWVSAVGVIGDSGAKDHPEFVKKILKKYNVKIKKDKTHFFDTFFGTLSNMINSGKIMKGNDGAQIVFKLLQESSTPKEFYENAYKLREWSEKIDDYINQVTLDFEEKKETYKNLDLHFFAFRPEILVGSVISTIIAFKHPNQTIIIFSKKNGTTTVNYRRQDKKYDMGTLAQKAIKGLRHAGGGGHVPAAGGHILTKDLNYLKRNIIIELKKMMK